MKLTNLAIGVNTVAATTAITPSVTPIAPYREAVLVVWPRASANQAGQVQVSEDGSVWTNHQAYVAGVPLMINVTVYPYMRVNNTAGTAGATDFFLLGSP